MLWSFTRAGNKTLKKHLIIKMKDSLYQCVSLRKEIENGESTLISRQVSASGAHFVNHLKLYHLHFYSFQLPVMFFICFLWH